MQKHCDTWLSSIFEYPVFRIEVGSGELEELTSKYFAYAKVNVDDITSTKYLEDIGFFIVDTNIEFVCQKPAYGVSQNNEITIRLADNRDADEIRKLAHKSFSQTRFHADPYIDNEISNKIKSKWAGNYFTGTRGDVMLVAEKEGQVIGFNQVLVKNNIATIDLIAVKEAFRGQGVAKSLIMELQKSYNTIRVGTQLTNKNSVSLYTKIGFTFDKASYVLHYHSTV